MRARAGSAVIEFPMDRVRPSGQREPRTLPAEILVFTGVQIERLGEREHDPQKWKPLLRQDHAQDIDLARVPGDQAFPPGRNAR